MAVLVRNLKSYPPNQILNYRVFASLSILWLVVLVFRKAYLRQDLAYYKQQTSNKKYFWGILFLSSVLLTGNWLSYIYLVNYISVQAGAFAYMVCPLLTAIGAFFILKEKLSSLKWIAISISIVSAIILGWGHPMEVFWSFFVAILFAGYLIVQRSIQGFNKLNLLGLQLLLSCLFIIPLEVINHHTVPVTIGFWVNILILAVVFTIIPLFLSLYSMIKIPASTAGILIYINPIIAFAVAYFYYNEGFTTQKLISYSLLGVAVVLFNWEYLKRILPKMA
ncbi:EamA-like transporter family protein [compost metagenome]